MTKLTTEQRVKHFVCVIGDRLRLCRIVALTLWLQLESNTSITRHCSAPQKRSQESLVSGRLCSPVVTAIDQVADRRNAIPA